MEVLIIGLECGFQLEKGGKLVKSCFWRKKDRETRHEKAVFGHFRLPICGMFKSQTLTLAQSIK
jgi:hypothetical protein